MRGRYASGGWFDPLGQDGRDGEDTLAWVAAQGWSNGRTGMAGGSYISLAQWKTAVRNPASLKAIFLSVSGTDDYFDRFYTRGGALRLGHRLLWLAENLHAPGMTVPPLEEITRTLPLRKADLVAAGQRLWIWQQALDHPAYDKYWRDYSPREKLERVNVPVFLAAGWFDPNLDGDLEAFTKLQQLGKRVRGIVGPWTHDMRPPEGFGREAGAPMRTLQMEWFDAFLKPELKREAPQGIRLFVMGANVWREEREWPLERARMTPYYFASRKGANSSLGDGQLVTEPPAKERADVYIYDPRKPVPTVGGANCCSAKKFPWGPLDQREVERRGDVLVYSTPPLEREMEVTGAVELQLHAATSAPDTDLTCKLVDVFPDGTARLLNDGMLRLRYRESMEQPKNVTPNQMVSVRVPCGTTSNVFGAGHRVRVEVSSSNFPRFDRNPNTGRPVANEVEMKSARQRVWQGGARASHVLLPVIPAR